MLFDFTIIKQPLTLDAIRAHKGKIHENKIIHFCNRIIFFSIITPNAANAEPRLNHSYYTEMPSYKWMRSFYKHQRLDEAPAILKQQSVNGAFDYKNSPHHK